MRAVGRRVAGLAVAALALVIVAGGTRWPWTAASDDLALIRLDWRARGERVEECRPPTAEEIGDRPPHMRPREICEGKVSPYALRVLVDDKLVVNDTLHAAGAHEDRPLYVTREIVARPGLHDLRIDFRKVVPRETGGEADWEEGEGPDDDEEDSDDEEDRDDDEEDGDDDEEDGDDDEGDERDIEPHAAEVTPSVRLQGTFRLEPRQVLVVTYDPDRRDLVASAAPVR